MFGSRPHLEWGVSEVRARGEIEAALTGIQSCQFNVGSFGRVAFCHDGWNSVASCASCHCVVEKRMFDFLEASMREALEFST